MKDGDVLRPHQLEEVPTHRILSQTRQTRVIRNARPSNFQRNIHYSQRHHSQSIVPRSIMRIQQIRQNAKKLRNRRQTIRLDLRILLIRHLRQIQLTPINIHTIPRTPTIQPLRWHLQTPRPRLRHTIRPMRTIRLNLRPLHFRKRHTILHRSRLSPKFHLQHLQPPKNRLTHRNHTDLRAPPQHLAHPQVTADAERALHDLTHALVPQNVP